MKSTIYALFLTAMLCVEAEILPIGELKAFVEVHKGKLSRKCASRGLGMKTVPRHVNPYRSIQVRTVSTKPCGSGRHLSPDDLKAHRQDNDQKHNCISHNYLNVI